MPRKKKKKERLKTPLQEKLVKNAFSWECTTRNLVIFKWLKLMKKALQNNWKSIFDSWSDCREPLLKTVLRIFSYNLCNRWKKYYPFILLFLSIGTLRVSWDKFQEFVAVEISIFHLKKKKIGCALSHRSKFNILINIYIKPKLLKLPQFSTSAQY